MLDAMFVTNIFADKMQAVAFFLIAAMTHDDAEHAQSHKSAEHHHGGLHREIPVNQQGVDRKHDQNGEVFVEVLHGDRAAGAHQHVTAVLQQGVHRNHEEAGENADGDHDSAGPDHSIADFKAEDFNDAGNETLIVEACAPTTSPMATPIGRTTSDFLSGMKAAAPTAPRAIPIDTTA